MTSAPVWTLAPGLLVRDWGESLGAVYVSSSAATHLCNEQALTILDVLARAGPLPETELTTRLWGDGEGTPARADGVGLADDEFASRLSALLEQMREQGLLMSATGGQPEH